MAQLPGVFIPTGQMSTPRAYHAATLLLSGKILITGGLYPSSVPAGPFTYLSSAELYDPATGRFTSAGNMTTIRLNHNSILLADGRVLIVGGSSQPLSTEIYNPSSGSFAASADLLSAPVGFGTVTLLQDGRVFIPGVSTAQIFDPVTGKVTATGPYVVPAPATVKSATLLQDGRVLVTGGTADSGWSEIYDPVANSFSPAGIKDNWDDDYTATLLPNGKIFFVGNDGNDPTPDDAEIFDPATAKFTRIANAISNHDEGTATLLSDGTVLIAGGVVPGGNGAANSEIYSPSTGSFSVTGSMSFGRYKQTATLLPDGTVLIAGGFWIYPGPATQSAELYVSNQVSVTVPVTSTPSGLTVMVDSTPVTTPHTFTWAVGSCHNFSATAQPGATGTQYLPAGNLPASQCFPFSAGYNYNFNTQYFLSTSATAGGTISPPSGWYNAGAVVSISAVPAAGYSFAGFSGLLTGAANPQTIVLNAPVAVIANFTPPLLNSGLDFYPVMPCRVADTRAAAGFSGQFGPPSLGGGTSRTFQIPSSACGIPPTATAYSLNFTVVPPAGGAQANLTAWPSNLAMPNVSTLNYSGNVAANAAIVPAAPDGSINVYVNSPTDLLFDIDGYFAPPLASGLEFYPVTPCRVADTRADAGFSGPFGPPSIPGGTTRTFTLPSSSCGVPATASAYSLNFTVVPPVGGPAANLTTWPASAAMPNVSTVNFAGSVVANAAVVPAGSNDAINVFVNNAANVLFDVNGYFAPASVMGLHFYPVAPCRVADTRTGAGFSGTFGPPAMAAGTTRTFNISAGACGIPVRAAAYSLNFTVVPPAGGPQANLTTWPAGTSMPNVSTLNYSGSVVANAAIVPAGSNGGINVYVDFGTDVLFDVNGYFAP